MKRLIGFVFGLFFSACLMANQPAPASKILTTEDLAGYWCLDKEYNRIPHCVLHFVDDKTAIVYKETGVQNLFHGVVGLEIPGFNGLFYCPQDDSIFGYTFTDGTVRISNGMTLKVTKKGFLKLEATGLVFRKFDQRTFAEEILPVDDNRGNPKTDYWGPVPGLMVGDRNPR